MDDLHQPTQLPLPPPPQARVASRYHDTNRYGNNRAWCRWKHDLCKASRDKPTIQDSSGALIGVRSKKNDDDVVEGGDRSQMLEMDISHGIKDEQGKQGVSLYFGIANLEGKFYLMK